MFLRMKNLMVAGAALLSLSLPGVASADFVSADWKTAGDNRAVIDTDTGLEWLKINQTLGWSVDNFYAQTGVGGQFEGFRLATQAEVNDMMDKIYPTRDAANDSNGRLDWRTGYTGGDYTPYESVWSPFTNVFGWGRSYTFEGGRSRNYVGYALYENNGLNETRNLELSDYLLAGTFLQRNQNGSTSRYHDYTSYIYEDYESAGYTSSYVSSNVSLFVVGDSAGVTLSGINNPNLVANNVSDVAAPFAAMGGLMMLGLAGFRRKK